MHVWIPRVLTQLDKLKATVAPGRPKKVMPGGYLADLIALRKVLLFCPSCLKDFDGRPYRYCREEMLCWAKCDLCRTPTQNAQAFIPEEYWATAHAGQQPPTKGRWALPPMNQRRPTSAVLKKIPKLSGVRLWQENIAHVLGFKR